VSKGKAKEIHMECSTKVFGEGSLGIKAQMSAVTGCLVWAFPGSNIKNAKKLSGGLAALNAATHGAIVRALESKDLDTTSGSTLLLNATDAWAKLGLKADRLLLVCCGEEQKIKPKQAGNTCSKWISAGLKSLLATTSKDAVWVFDDFSAKDGLTQVRLLVQLAREQVYKFGARHPQFKTKPVEKSPTLKKLIIASDAKNNKAVIEAVAEGRAIANGMDLAKDLGNLPPNICNPTYLATSAKKLGKDLGLKVEVLGRKEIEALKMGAFLAVTQGAVTPPQFIVIRHQGGRATDAPIVLVGKGITFDTGGISLKPGEGMDEMKYDMCGAASVIGTMRAVAELKLKKNVIGVIPTCENMPSGQATRPGDIVTSMSGQTIEILNTDAEGRLILCDALTYVERFKPAAVIDIATLTGACVIALGAVHSGLFSDDDALAESLLSAGRTSQDTVWRMPLDSAYQEQLKSNFADMANIGGRPAGSVTAACFLARYTEKYSWAHLDIAGTAWKSGAAKGSTGRPVPLLVNYLLTK
jgi:leucyl aminopeptidase